MASTGKTSTIKARDAWLALFSCDEPEVVVEPCEKYPEFRKMYEEGYEICQDTERVMEMFSKELYELDRNTVQYMIDEMQDTIDAQKEEIGKQQDTIDAQKEEIGKQQGTIDAQKEEIGKQQGTIDFQKEELEKRNAE